MLSNSFEIEGVEDGEYAIVIEGLPEGAFVPGSIFVANGSFDLELLITDLIGSGLYTLSITVYGEDGNVVFSTTDFMLDIAASTGESEAPAEQMPATPTPQVPPPAPTAPPATMNLVIGQTSFTQNGMASQAAQAPFIDPDTNRTMVPLRTIAEGLGAAVSWDDATRTVTITRNGQVLPLPLDVPFPNGMGTPMVVGDRTFVPVNYIAQMLGAEVTWNEATQSVTITQ